MKIKFLYLFLLICVIGCSKNYDLQPFVSDDNGKVGYWNQNKEIIVQPQFYTATHYDNKNYAIVTIGRKNSPEEQFAVIDRKGNYLINFNEGYQYIAPHYESPYKSSDKKFKNWLLVIKDEKWGYINTKGQTVIPLIYENLDHFNIGLSYAKKNGKYGYIDSKNSVIIDFKYDYAYSFGATQSDGNRYAMVELNNKCGHINYNGKTIINLEYDSCFNFHDGIATVKKGDKYGCIDTTGKIIIPFEYEFIGSAPRNGVIYARKIDLSRDYDYFNLKGEYLGNDINLIQNKKH